MLKTLKGLFKSRTPPPPLLPLTQRMVHGRFDAAQTTRDNIRHWAAADFLSADAEASPEVRRTLRQRARYEVANNSYARGLCLMLATDTIGTGPRLQMTTEDEDFNDEIESAFACWAETAKLAGKLRTMRIARCQDGESFAILMTNPKIFGPVKLDLCPIEADRVTGDGFFFLDTESIDGIHYDSYGNPAAYRMLKYHPGDMQYFGPEEALMVPAEYMLHIFRQDRPGLHRGIPELTAALPLFAQLRRYNLAVLSAAEAAADFAAVLYTDAPPNGESDAVEPMDTIPLERNMMLTVPAGWKLGQLDPKQPTSNHAEFVRIVLSEIARCVTSTYGTLAGDFSGHNYASGRLDNQIYHKSILVDRSFWESEILNPLFRAWYREYLLVRKGGLPDNGTPEGLLRPIWFWDGFPHVDPSKEAAAQEKRLANHTTTLAAECAKDGRDYLAVLRQRGKELKLMRELGIPLPATQSSDAPPGADPEDDSEPNSEDIPKKAKEV